MKNLLEALTEGLPLPEGCDTWGIRSVNPDFTSNYDYIWPFPGKWAIAPGPIIDDNHGARPSGIGDGICLAFNWEKMASGGIPARTLLLCAFSSADILGKGKGAVRLRKALVVTVFSGESLLRNHGIGANLTRANLTRADLTGANLTRADLTGANLTRADLYGANLSGADLSGADLSWANLYGANLYGANLRRADLTEANLYGAKYSGFTEWPAEFDPASRGAVKIN